jgi:hypothetical protein
MIALGFGAASAAWLLLLIAPLVALYYLKLKRPQFRVPSLCLWRAVLEDQRVNSPFQRFKRNLLLLLQLLLLGLCILAAMLPYFRGGLGGADRTLVLLDCSASMAARDAETKHPRLELAQAAAAALIDSLQPDQELALIGFAQHARQLAAFTSNKRMLQQALAQLTVEDVASDLHEALRMAEAMARTAPVRRVILVSDGNFAADVAFDLPYELDYRLLPAAGPNLGITQVRARRRPGGGWSVFAGLQATEGVLPGAVLELHRNGQLAGTEPIVLRSDGSQRLVFALADADHGSLELRVRTETSDALAADDQAFLELTPPRDLRVHVDADLTAWRHAVAVSTGVQLAAEGDAGKLDLVIARDPARAPAAVTAFFDGAIPEGFEAAVEVRPTDQGDAAIDWRHDSQLLEHVELGEVLFLDQPAWRPGAGEGDLERIGGEVLVHGRRGPLLAQRITEERSTWFLLAPSERSTLPYRVAFPILVANLLRMAGDRAGLLEVEGARAGILPPLRLPRGVRCEVTAPDGSVRVELTDVHGTLADVPAPRVGRYIVATPGVEAAVGINLLCPTESLLARTEKIALSEHVVTAAARVSVDVDQPLWALCAMLATVVLLIEWWYFHRPVRRRAAPAVRSPLAGQKPRGMPA